MALCEHGCLVLRHWHVGKLDLVHGCCGRHARGPILQLDRHHTSLLLLDIRATIRLAPDGSFALLVWLVGSEAYRDVQRPRLHWLVRCELDRRCTAHQRRQSKRSWVRWDLDHLPLHLFGHSVRLQGRARIRVLVLASSYNRILDYPWCFRPQWRFRSH